MSATGKYWVWSLFITVVFIAIHGYLFNCSDQEEHLPQVYKLLDNSLYKGDYVVENLVSDFSIRFFYVRVVYFFSLFLPVSAVCFLLYLTLTTVSVYFAIRLAVFFLSNDAASVIIISVVFLLLNNFTVGGNNIHDNILTCTVFANAGCFAAWYYFFKKNYYTAFASAGAASLFQVLMGLHVFVLMLMLLMIFENQKRYIKLLLSFGIYLLFAAPMLLPILYRQFLIKSDVPDELFYYTLYVFRNPHHYLPGYFSVNDYLKSAVLLATAGISALILKPFWKKDFFAITVFIISGMIGYYFLMEIFEMHVVGKLQWFKTSVWLTFFCCIACGSWITHIPFLNKWFSIRRFWNLILIFSFTLLLLLLNTKYLPLGNRQYNYHAGNFKSTHLSKMHEWIKTHTEKDALFITLPDDDSFLCEAKRPLIVAYKAVIHEPWFMVQWYLDFLNAYKVTDEINWLPKHVIQNALENYYSTNNYNYLLQHHVKYRVDDITKCKYKNELGKVVFKSGNYVLTKL